MLQNNLYNLMHQLVQENKSLWRIKSEYLKDAEGDENAISFWKKMESDKESHVKELQEMIKNRM